MHKNTRQSEEKCDFIHMIYKYHCFQGRKVQHSLRYLQM